MLSNNDLLVQLVLAALSGDQKTARTLALTVVRLLKKDAPEHAHKLANALAHYDVGNSVFRAEGLNQPPTDKDSGLGLVRIVGAPNEEPPVLNSKTKQLVDRFLKEHMSAAKLLASGLNPPSSLLLVGEPGVGKTMLGEYLAAQTKRKLLVLDLATAVSSLLGKTGQNLRTVLDFARDHSAVLFLDEFDSIAKRRDDPTDLGELKRIVNILLKELETWPPNSLLVAATNHPELLDRAIWRRFDAVISIAVPQEQEREALLTKQLPQLGDDPGFLKVLIQVTDGLNASALVKFGDRVKRRIALEEAEIHKAALEELVPFLGDKKKKARSELLRLCQKYIPRVTYEELASWLGVSVSTVHYHVKGKNRGART